MAKTEEVTYEVLVLIGSRWEAQGVYKAREQHRAVADAKSLEKVSTIKGVKVVKEFYDEKLKTSRTLNVYESKIKGEPAKRRKTPPAKVRAVPRAKPKKAGKVKSGASPSEDMVGTPDQDGGAPKRPSFLSIFAQIIASLVAAAIAAIVVTQMATMVMRDTQTIGFVGRNDFLIMVFILVFAITGLALITRILTKLKRIGPDLSALTRAAPKPQPAPYVPPKPKPKPHLGKPHAPSSGPNSGPDEVNADPVEPVEPPETVEPVAPEELAPLPDDVLSEVLAMNAFTADVVDVIKGEEDKRDSHTVFGVVLFLVGAVQALRSQKKLSDETYHQVVYQTLGALGLSKERAHHFIDNTDDYLISNARYSQMFQSGRNAMSASLESGIGPRGALMDVMDDWDKPNKAKADNQQPVTVLFTDIAGSTAMTQKLGDAGAQNAVRVHNTIVRDAIRAFAGREIKHTGDGIMASFSSAAQGVEAALDMQRHAKTHSENNPDLPLGLKIGLNAGEPIAEDDDLFGTTVQLAARIVDKAQAGQVLVSGSVHGLSQGKNLKFERFGDLEMKGFDETVTVYTALWEGSPVKAKPVPVMVPPTPEPKPEPTPEPTPEPKPEPEAAPEEPAAEATPDAAPEAVPEATPEAAPAANGEGEQKPAAPNADATPPAATKPAASKPAASKPAASKPAASKPAASKPDVAPSDTKAATLGAKTDDAAKD